ncbi:hypothetical protein Tco_1016659 [Tanacetum coccineum]|uniref:Retrotransposon gag domain-containing protein n=1 Tax=Tanacetum coccineum TaxID=301880 RepID=A0ABQ5FQA4_9ASTR
MAPATRNTTSSSNGEGVDDSTRRYVDEALAGIRQSMQEMLNQINGLSLQNQDVRGWIFRCEQFFIIDVIPDEQKVRLLSVHLFDKALLWHRQFMKVHGENVSWPIYRDAVIQRFGTVFDDPMAELKILQEATLNAVKKKNKMQLGVGSNRYGSNSGNNGSNSKPLLALPSAYESWNNKPNTAPPRKQLTQKEYEEKRAKNFCFYCDKKFVSGHKCEGRLFTLIVLADTEELEEKFVDADGSLEEMESNDVQPQIYLNALSGVSSFQTLRVVGLFGNKHEQHILVNSSRFRVYS